MINLSPLCLNLISKTLTVLTPAEEQVVPEIEIVVKGIQKHAYKENTFIQHPRDLCSFEEEVQQPECIANHLQIKVTRKPTCFQRQE